MHSLRRNAHKKQQGVAMVEFAICLPLLLLLLLAIGEFGRLLYQYNSLLQASRDAGRYAAREAWNETTGQIDLNSDLQSKTKSIAVYGVPSNPANYSAVVPGLVTDDVSVTAAGSEHVQVQINYLFQPVVGATLPTFFGEPIPLGITLTSSVVMRVL